MYQLYLPGELIRLREARETETHRERQREREASSLERDTYGFYLYRMEKDHAGGLNVIVPT